MYYYIINPAAGKGRIDKIQNKLKAFLKHLGIAGEYVKTTGPKDITKLTELALNKASNTIVAVGGDGTVNEVANHLVGQKAALGIIPIGKTNSLAKTLGIFSWEEACQILAARKLEKIDMGQITNLGAGSEVSKKRYFVTAATLGFESEIAPYRTELSFFSKINFLNQVVKKLCSPPSQKLTLEIDDSFTLTTKMFSLVVANCWFSQKENFRPNPIDQKLDVLIVSKISRFTLFKNLSSIIKGEYERFGETSIFQAQKVKIFTAKPQEISIDGEALMKTPVQIEIVPHALKVIVGKKRKF